jgi:hypothetical protein
MKQKTIRNRSLNMNLKKINYILVFIISMLFIAQVTINAEGDKDKSKRTLQKVQTQVPFTYLDINNVFTVFRNNGISDIDRDINNSGLVFPKGSGKTAAFTSGLLWGATIPGDPQPRVGGTAYATGIQPGKILENGLADDPELDVYRIYRVRPDIYPGGPSVDLSLEATLETSSESAIRTQYDLDWTEWPVQLGAPYYDGNGNGVYDAVPDPDPLMRDIPGVTGADQTLWFVGNDLNPTLTGDLYGATPMGIEIQATYWAYNQQGALGNMFFRKYKVINKGAQQDTFENMYFSMWSDVDLGGAGDDFVGVDTVLSLQYCYNASATDATYQPLPPPALGFDFFQGPLLDGVAGEDRNKNGVDDIIDFAIFNNSAVGPGKINLPMTAAYYFANGDPNIGDPPQGDLDGSTEFYNFFQGLFGVSGAPFIDFATGQVTTYALNGDPITRTGWLDGDQLAPGDRRQGSSSGPFTMAPGDTQEVVVAEIVAGAIPGVDRISAIGLLKFYDQIAQVAYDNFFDLPVAPPAPVVTVTELDREIILDWSKDPVSVKASEWSNIKGYKFQGYNVYQLPSASASVSEGVRVATYDMIDGIGKIFDLVFDPTTGTVVTLPVQFGNDTGTKRYISLTRDEIKGGVPLINGIKYYYAVTSYSYNPDPDAVPNNLENPLSIITVVPHMSDPGVTYGEGSGTELDVTHSEGAADGVITVSVVDPAATTGQDYDITFSTQQQIRNENGDWVAASTVLRKFNPGDPDTLLPGTTIDIAAIYAGDGTNIDLECHLEIVHHYYGHGDGVTMTFPVGTRIIDVPPFSGQGSDPDTEPFVPVVIEGNVVKLGVTDDSESWHGVFHEGGEDWVVNVDASTVTLPISVDWEVHDDGYYGYGAANVTGTTITNDTLGFASRLAQNWNLFSNGTPVLEHQGVYNGTDFWPPRDDRPTNLGLVAAPEVDGIQLNIDVGWEAPITFFDVSLSPDDSPTTLSSNSTTTNLDIQNYTIFGGVITSKVIDNFGVGTNELTELQQDYELRFTGVLDSLTLPDGRKYIYVSEGGSMGTIFRIQGGDFTVHPGNTAGVAGPFQLLIPFEVWNVSDPENEFQVNLTFRDRLQAHGPGGDDPLYSWNLVNRMYACIVNSPYDDAQPIQVDDGPDALNALATWVLVFYGTNYTLGDVVTVTYANPIVAGLDRWSFSSTESTFSNALAKTQVSDINVFPNPYYGINTEELNKYNRFVTFSHLPDNATIRIFNLAGVLVQKIVKDPSSGQFQRWDLSNEAGLPVASGLYIAYIELPDLGETKVLKIAVIQEQQILDRF